MDAAALAYVKSVILRGMADPSQTVRQTVGTVIVNLMVQTEDGGWPEGLETLMRAIDSQDENEQEVSLRRNPPWSLRSCDHVTVQGAFNSLVKIAEDGPTKLDCEINGQRPINYLMERFLAHTEHSNPRIRVYALTCIKHYLYLKNQAAMVNIDNIMQAMFRRASDTSSDVRCIVCQCLSTLLTMRPDKLLPEMSNVAEYMLYSARDQDETVALEASEFWLTFGEDPALSDALRPWLPKVAPLLLSGMVYSQSDLDWLGGADDEDEAVPDKESDIKPRFHGAKSHAQEHEEDPSATNGNRKAQDEGEDDEESEYDYDDDEDEEDMTGEWNLRKCSAAALDVMSVTFGDEMLEILLPYLKEKLFSDNWQEKESGILALGAIAEGCMHGVRPHLPQLMPFLVTSLSDPKVRLNVQLYTDRRLIYSS
jgi:transportin-1